ncbi:MAG: hypothetical protein MJZ53_01080 [Paludibacteraceae bacterium]|nr:hypothetical protein [Paludibacteraceae bacterium]
MVDCIPSQNVRTVLVTYSNIYIPTNNRMMTLNIVVLATFVITMAMGNSSAHKANSMDE